MAEIWKIEERIQRRECNPLYWLDEEFEDLGIDAYLNTSRSNKVMNCSYFIIDNTIYEVRYGNLTKLTDRNRNFKPFVSHKPKIIYGNYEVLNLTNFRGAYSLDLLDLIEDASIVGNHYAFKTKENQYLIYKECGLTKKLKVGRVLPEEDYKEYIRRVLNDEL